MLMDQTRDADEPLLHHALGIRTFPSYFTVSAEWRGEARRLLRELQEGGPDHPMPSEH